MDKFIGYTYDDKESAIANSMGFLYTRWCDDNMNNGLGGWLYFYRGRKIAYDRGLYK